MITKAYFIVGPQYVRYDAATDRVDAGYPKTVGAAWAGFTAAGFERGIDAAVDWPGGKVFFFKGAQYLRYDVAGNRVDDGYPLAITDQWTGLREAGFASDIDAGVNWGNGKAYLFKGTQYVRYDIAADHVDEGFPRVIADGWPGFAAAGFVDAIDAVANWGNGKVYFFRGNQYLRYDIANDRVDDDFPQTVDDQWAGLGPARRGARIDAIWVRAGAPSADFSYLSDTFFSELRAVCTRLGCAAEDLLSVMESESGVQPWAQNPHGMGTGLIGFMPTTLAGLGWTQGPNAFKVLSADEQLPYVERYYRPYAGQLSSAGRLYQATFLPATLPGTDESSIIAAPGGPNAGAYNDNPVLDTNHDGVITVSDLTARLNRVRQGDRWAALTQRLLR